MGRLAAVNREGKMNIQSLRPDYRAMARMIAVGASNTEIMEQFNLSAAQVSLVVNSPLFRAEVIRLQNGLELSLKDGAIELQELQSRAIEVIAQDIWAERPSAGRTRAAFDVLDRTGLHKKSDPISDNRQVTINYFSPRPGDDPAMAKKAIEDAKSAQMEAEDVFDCD